MCGNNFLFQVKRGASDFIATNHARWSRWTRGPHDQESGTCVIVHLSEQIRTVDRDNYNRPHSIIKWTSYQFWTTRSRSYEREEAALFLLQAMKSNLNHRSTIGRSSREDVDSSIGTRSEPSIVINCLIQRPRPFLKSFKNSSSRQWTCPQSFVKFSLFRESFCVPLVRDCSWLIFASIECLKSNFDRRRRMKSHLGLHFRLRKLGMKSLASGD